RREHGQRGGGRSWPRRGLVARAGRPAGAARRRGRLGRLHRRLARGSRVSSLATSGPVWYLMRASGVVTLILLTAVFVLGVMTTSRWRARRLPGFAALSLHRSVSLLSVLFLAVHVV